MKRRPVLLLVLFLGVANAQAQTDDFPSYETVYRRFFATYSVDSLQLGGRYLLHFARKPGGWAIQLERSDSREITLDQPFWDKARGGWDSLGQYFPLVKDSADASGHSSEYASETPYYALNLFFGYRGWEADVIRTLKPTAAGLTDRQLYQLGRAYLSYSSYTLWPQLVHQNESLKVDSTLDPEDLPEETVKTYIRYADSAILLFEKLKNRNPRFPTLTGDIGNDYANTCMTAYYFLRIAHRDTAARKYLRDGLYDEFTLNYYRNVFLSCEDRTVLFASGDDDCFVPLYLQERYGLRPDITVVLGSYLQFGRYVHYVTRLLPLQQRLATTLPEDLFTPMHPAWHFVVDADLGSSNATDFVRTVATHWENTALNDGVVANKPVRLTFPIMAGADSGRFFFWTLTEQKYILKGDLCFAGFFAANGFRRPVVFTNPGYGLAAYCRLSGLMSQVYPDSTDQTLFGVVSRNNAVQLLGTYRYPGLDSPSIHTVAATHYLDWYSYAFYETADELIHADEKPMAVSVLDRYFTLFPDRLVPFGHQTFSLIQLYYFADVPSKGDSLIRVLTDELLNDFDARMKDQKTQLDALRQDYATVQEMVQLLNDFGRTGEIRAKVVRAKNYMIIKFGIGVP